MSLSRPLRQWWSRTSDAHLVQAQSQLLTSLVNSPVASAGKTTHGLNIVTFAANNNKKNDSSSSSSSSLPTVVLLHGFGSGLGFYYANVDLLLASNQIGKVVLIDWLGMGGSHRPPCRRPIRGLSECTSAWCQSRFNPSQAVDFFINPLHEYLTKELLATTHSTGGSSSSSTSSSPIWMVGHSLGGYLAARYVWRHVLCNQDDDTSPSPSPTMNIEKLILASPVGFPAKPNNVLTRAQLPTSMRLVDALWSANVTPQQLVRAMGATRGQNAVRRALAGRIPHVSPSHQELLANYLYHITVAHPSGEFAMNSLLEPAVAPDLMGVFAREPLEELWRSGHEHENDPQQQNSPHKKNNSSSSSSSLQMRVLFGDADWMRPNQPSATKTLEVLQDKHDRVRKANVAIVPQAGHHLYLDNPYHFVEQILRD